MPHDDFAPNGIDALVGLNLRSLREAAAVSRPDLASACGLDDAALAAIEAGMHCPAGALLFALRRLDARPADVFRAASTFGARSEHA